MSISTIESQRQMSVEHLHQIELELATLKENIKSSRKAFEASLEQLKVNQETFTRRQILAEIFRMTTRHVKDFTEYLGLEKFQEFMRIYPSDGNFAKSYYKLSRTIGWLECWIDDAKENEKDSRSIPNLGLGKAIKMMRKISQNAANDVEKHSSRIVRELESLLNDTKAMNCVSTPDNISESEISIV